MLNTKRNTGTGLLGETRLFLHLLPLLCSALLCSAPPHCHRERGEDIFKLSAPSARTLFASDQRSEQIKGKEAERSKQVQRRRRRSAQQL